MEVQRIGIKFFAADPSPIRLDTLIPVFHGWIQKQNVTGHLLIDVHDYSHLHQGPGILLVAHEGNFSVDMSDGRPGLVYYRKTPTTLSPIEHLRAVLRSALQACRLLEKDARIRFNLDEFAVFANDRLNAPNDQQTFTELEKLLSPALKLVFEGAEFKLVPTSLDPKERLTVTCTRM
jgi:aconitase B